MNEKLRGLSLRKIASMGLRALWRHKIRFIFVTLLFSLTLSFFIFGVSAQCYDAAADYLNFYKSEGRETVSIFAAPSATLTDPIEIAAYNAEKYIQLRVRCPDLTFDSIYHSRFLLSYPTEYREINNLTSGAVNVDGEADFKNGGLRLNAGRLPENAGEICVSEFHYRLFRELGYQRTNTADFKFDIASYDDLLGRESSHGSGIIIVGVIDTFFNTDFWLPLITENPKAPRTTEEYTAYHDALDLFSRETDRSVSAAIFATSDSPIFREAEQVGVYTKLQGKSSADIEIFRAAMPIFVSEGREVAEKFTLDFAIFDAYFQHWCETQLPAKFIANMGFLFMGIFGVFTVLMMFQFIGVSIKNEQRKIGIFRALGAKTSSVFGIFLTESVIIAAIAFAVGGGLSYFVGEVYRILVLPKFPFFSYVSALARPSWLGILCGAAFAAGIAMVGTLIPFLPTLKKKPAEIIRK